MSANKTAYYQERVEDPERAGDLQDESLTLQASLKNLHPETTIVLFVSSTCPHCQKILPKITEFQKKHPEVFIETRYVDESDVSTNMLEAVEKGVREVPAALVNGRFLVKKDTNFMFRLTYAISLSKTMPPLEEEEEACHFKLS